MSLLQKFGMLLSVRRLKTGFLLYPMKFLIFQVLIMLVEYYPPYTSVLATIICPISFLQVENSVVGLLLEIRELEKPSSAISYFICSHNLIKLSYITNTADLRFFSVKNELLVVPLTNLPMI